MTLLPPGARQRLDITIDRVGTAAVLTVAGEIDMYTVAGFRKRVDETLEAGANVLIIDLAGLEFTDSMGLGALIRAHRHARDRGAVLMLAAVPEQTLKVLKITALDRILAAYDTVEDALAAVVGPVRMEAA